jgi:hypothetical protein
MIETPLQPAQSDEIDRVLRAYYQSQMPDSWPAAPRPLRVTLSMPTPPRQRAFAGMRRRLALAASIALLIAGAFFASGKIAPSGPTDGDPLKDPSAKVPPELRRHPPGDGDFDRLPFKHNDLKSATKKTTR